MALVARNLAQLLVRIAFSEAEDPKHFLRRMSAKAEIAKGQKPADVRPCDQWDEWDELEEWQHQAAYEMQREYGLLECHRHDSWSLTVGTRGHQWYTIFENEEAAEQAAVANVRGTLESEPELFTQDWLETHINLPRLRQYLHQDARDDDYWDHEYPEYSDKITELVERDYLEDTFNFDEDGNEIELTPEMEKIVDDKWEEMIEGYANNRMEDPIDYLAAIYGREDAVKEAIKMVGIDIDAAAQDAVNTDGWRHFLARDDGNSYDLPGGYLYVKD